MILNEAKTGGANYKEFTKAISGKSNKENHSLISNALRNYQENSLANWLIISGREKGKSFRFDQIQNQKIFCNKNCRADLPYAIASLIFFSLGVILLFKNLVFKSDLAKRNFIIIVSVWFLTVFAVYLPLSYDISPRFFLLTAPIYIIFLGFVLELAAKLHKGWLLLIIVGAFITSNLYFTYMRFNEMLTP